MGDAQTLYEVAWDEDAGLVRCTWLPGAVCGLDEASAVTDEIRAMDRGPVPVLVDMREMAKLERSAREHFSFDQGGVTAIALFAGSPVTRMMANFFIGMRRLPVPIKMFTDEDQAVAWLMDPT